MHVLYILACLISLGYSLPNPINPNCGPLCDYVHRPDSTYEWSGPIATYPRNGYTTYILNMTSQQWFDEELSDRPIWWHYVAVHIPDEIRFTGHGFLYIGTSNNNAGIPGPDDRHIGETGIYANRTKMVTAAIRQIPNQPISFLGESLERTEDAIIAWTWQTFLENEDTDPELLLRMPMCKAVSRAMDTITDFAQEMVPSVHINEYMVAGESKRGWTTWLQGVVDRRVIAMAPVVLSCLNMNPNMHHYYQSLGGWPLYFGDYWTANITSWIDHPRFQVMMDIIDPYVYREEFLTMPKLMISGSSDEFFMPDDYDYYFDDLVGDKYIWLLENTGHSISGSPLNADFWRMLETFYISVIEDYPRPVFSWTKEIIETGGSITLIADQTPTGIEAWWAETPELVCESEACRRDFRFVVNIPPVDSPIEWFSMEVEDLGSNEYRVELDNAENPDLYRAFFIKVHFDGPEGREYIFTSEANIIPDGFPFEDCEGTDCRGVLK